jgi:lipoprotein-anchoring transpeptidase ErfK/SrfK
MKRWAIRSSFLTIALLLCPIFGASGQIVEIPTNDDSVAPREFANRRVRLEIKRGAHQVTLYRGEAAVKNYPIAVGRAGWETPLGIFHVFQMLRDPDWKHPLSGKVFPAGEPGNELGRYWIGFAQQGDNCVGFHATPHPNTVGKSLSHGCIRMYEKDIEELFSQVSLGTTVAVLP